MTYDFDRIVAENIIVECQSLDEQWSFVRDMYATYPEIVAPTCVGSPSNYVEEDKPCYRYDRLSRLMKIGSRLAYADRVNNEGYVFVPLSELALEDDFSPSSQSITAFLGGGARI